MRASLPPCNFDHRCQLTLPITVSSLPSMLPARPPPMSTRSSGTLSPRSKLERHYSTSLPLSRSIAAFLAPATPPLTKSYPWRRATDVCEFSITIVVLLLLAVKTGEIKLNVLGRLTFWLGWDWIHNYRPFGSRWSSIEVLRTPLQLHTYLHFLIYPFIWGATEVETKGEREDNLLRRRHIRSG